MSTAEFPQAGWATEGFRPVAQGKTVAMFTTYQKKNEYETKQQGRPVFTEEIHIIKIPADVYLRIQRRVRDEDKEEYPREWEQFQKTRETRILGFPIEHWQQLSDTQKEEFRAMKVYTVEQISGLPDNFPGMMGWKELRNKAKMFIETGRDAELIGKIRKEADDKISAMQARLEKMERMLEEKTAPESD